MTRRSLFLRMGAVVVSFCAVATASGQSDLEVRRAEFGLFNKDASDRFTFVPAERVPLVPGQAYGWRIFIKTNKVRVKWREEFELPQAPGTWGEGEAKGRYTISGDRRLSVTERETDSGRGVIVNMWSVAPSDPAGRYVMRIFVEGRLVATFDFDAQ